MASFSSRVNYFTQHRLCYIIYTDNNSMIIGRSYSQIKPIRANIIRSYSQSWEVLSKFYVVYLVGNKTTKKKISRLEIIVMLIIIDWKVAACIFLIDKNWCWPILLIILFQTFFIKDLGHIQRSLPFFLLFFFSFFSKILMYAFLGCYESVLVRICLSFMIM